MSRESVIRVSTDIVLDLFCGVDSQGRNTLIILTKERPTSYIQKQLISSNVISISLVLLEDKVTYKISASLIDIKYADLFKVFSDDVIKAAKRVSDK